MKLFGRAQCPYCGKKVNPVTSWGLRRRGEYRCPRCMGISNVFLSSAVPFMALGAIVLGALILLYTMTLNPAPWWSILAVLAPFVVFYLLCLFCVQLRRPVFRRVNGAPSQTQQPNDRKKEQQADSAPSESPEEMGRTRVL